MGGQPMWSNKNDHVKKSENLRVKKLSTSIKTSSSQPTVSVSTYTVVDEMAQAFSPMVTNLLYWILPQHSQFKSKHSRQHS